MIKASYGVKSGTPDGPSFFHQAMDITKIAINHQSSGLFVEQQILGDKIAEDSTFVTPVGLADHNLLFLNEFNLLMYGPICFLIGINPGNESYAEMPRIYCTHAGKCTFFAEAVCHLSCAHPVAPNEVDNLGRDFHVDEWM